MTIISLKNQLLLLTSVCMMTLFEEQTTVKQALLRLSTNICWMINICWNMFDEQEDISWQTFSWITNDCQTDNTISVSKYLIIKICLKMFETSIWQRFEDWFQIWRGLMTSLSVNKKLRLLTSVSLMISVRSTNRHYCICLMNKMKNKKTVKF